MDDGDTIQVTVAAVARTLGEGWRAGADPCSGMWDAELHGPGGVILDVHGFRMRQAGPLRMEIRGRFPPREPSPVPEAITCAAARGGRAIAGDIQARLLPAFTAQLDGVRAAAAARARDGAALAAVMADVARILGQPGGGYARAGGLQVNLFREGCAYGHVYGDGDGSCVTLDLRSVPSPVALRMLAVMAAAEREHEEG